jgi:aldehyde:ferredoxin oxidoreductase
VNDISPEDMKKIGWVHFVEPERIVCEDCYFTNPEFKNSYGSRVKKEYLLRKKKKERRKAKEKKMKNNYYLFNLSKGRKPLSNHITFSTSVFGIGIF